LFVCFELLVKKKKLFVWEEIKKGKAQNIGRSVYSCRPWACLWILVLSSLGSSSRSTSLLALLCSNKPKPTSHPHLHPHPKRDIREKERDRRRRRRRRRRSGDNRRWIWTSGSRRWKTVIISSKMSFNSSANTSVFPPFFPILGFYFIDYLYRSLFPYTYIYIFCLYFRIIRVYLCSLLLHFGLKGICPSHKLVLQDLVWSIQLRLFMESFVIC